MKWWVILPALCVSVSAWPQICRLPLEKSAPNERFIIDPSDNGVVVDQQTGLSWQRCVVGQELDDASTQAFLDDDTCQAVDEGLALTYTWYGALEYADEFSQTVVGTGWRMPNLKELASLVETSCFSPAINSLMFPGTPLDSFWSSTPHASTDSSAWTISFSVGEDSSLTKNTDAYVRLVRD